MSEEITIFYNPGCSKCRLSLELLTEQGEQPTVVEYLQSPPDAEELRTVLDLLSLEPRDLMRQHEAPYRENQLDNPDLTTDELIQAMVENPILIERPIVIKGDKAVIGRPPEKILEII